MKLSNRQRRLVRDLLASDSQSFVELTRIAALDPAKDFHEADLRGIDFATDDLGDFDFSGADLTGADLTRARGRDRLIWTGARIDRTRGLLIRDPPDGPELLVIPAGRFTMGVPPEESEREHVPGNYDDNARPLHEVTITRPFCLGRYPVTRNQFAAFVKASGYRDAGSDWRTPGFKQSGTHPVVNVSHADAEAYAAWLSKRTGKSYRLPSEAEWEYAARAGTTTARYWGDDRASACRYANVADEALRRKQKDQPDPERYFECDDGFANTSPVGSFLPNGFGLYDMLGNVWEWTADWWNETYEGAPLDGTAWTSGDAGRRVVRGGSWGGGPGLLRAGVRRRNFPVYRVDALGFRVARTY